MTAMNKRVYWLLTLAAITIIVLGLLSVANKVIVRYAGKKVVTVVTEVPSECDKYNYIKVLLDSTEYEVSISRTNCRDGVYKVGQRVELLKHKNYEQLEWPGSHPELVIILMISILFFGLFIVRRTYKRNKNHYLKIFKQTI
jgi:hypothetical protein